MSWQIWFRVRIMKLHNFFIIHRQFRTFSLYRNCTLSLPSRYKKVWKLIQGSITLIFFVLRDFIHFILLLVIKRIIKCQKISPVFFCYSTAKCLVLCECYAQTFKHSINSSKVEAPQKFMGKLQKFFQENFELLSLHYILRGFGIEF